MSSSSKGLFLGLGLLTCVLLVSGALAYRNTRLLMEASARVDHAHAVLETLERALATSTEAETGQRGYLLTGDLGYLQPYQAAVARIQEELQRLRRLAADTPAQELRIPPLEALIGAKLEELKNTIEMQHRDPAAARHMVQTHLGRNLMDGIRAQVGDMAREERELLADREQASRSQYRTAILSGATFALAGLALVAGVLLQLAGHLKARARTERALELQRQWLQVTLRSIGDGLIATDRAGAVAFMNPVAEALTGWRSDEATGQPLTTVFHLVPEETGAPAVPASDPVLPEGRVAGMAKRTTLVDRQGRSRPIEDSAAPIADAAGGTAGMVVVFHDASEKRRAEAELLEASRRKDEFLATLAHELRNPLAPIRTGAYLLGLRDTPDPELRQIHAVIARQSAHMARLVDDLLDVSRIERGKVELHKQPVELDRVVAQALEACQAYLDSRGHHVLLALPKPPVRLEADPVRLEQMLSNLLNNAGKCTPPGGELRLSATREGSELVLRLRDNGRGMTPEVLAHAFDLFYQGSQGLDRSDGGLGLGLTLVKRLALLHDGSVSASSDGPGLGSEFQLRLPALEPEAAPPDPSQAGPWSPEAARRHVLIIDDDPNVRQTSEMLLTAMNYRVTLAATGALGVAQAKALHPDIALIDLGMPGLNGLEVAVQIRAELGRAIYLVALTGYSRDSDLAETTAAGFDRHLVKSGDPGELLRLLREVH